MNTNDKNELEARVHRTLRSLPNRRAPSGLEARVLAELTRRAALPWWRKSFAHWPSAFRFTFLALSVAAAALLVYGAITVGNSQGAHALSGGLSSGFGWFTLARDIVLAARDRVASLVASVPRVWLYGGAAVIAVSYAAIGALGAATYRALSVERSPS
jgi:hypothetical protein